jgi:hypothetical protein
MERFQFHAKKISGEYEDGEIEAVNQNKALDELESRGLVVISLTKPGGPQPSASRGLKQPAGGARGEEEPSSCRQRESCPTRLLVHWVIVGLFILSVSFFVWTKTSATRPVKRVPYKILKVQSVEPKSFKRKDITLQVPEGSTSKIIKIAAQQAYDEQKAANAFLEEARFFFYSEKQDPEVHNPIATLRWNWEKYGKWEYNFTLGNEKDAGTKMIAERLQYKRDKFVSYKFTVPSNISIKAVQPLAEDQLVKLAAEWQTKAPVILADVYYEGYSRPLMHCEQPADPASKANCQFNAK